MAKIPTSTHPSSDPPANHPDGPAMPSGAIASEEGQLTHALPIVIPVAAEAATVTRRIVETGSGVRVLKTVTEREQIVDEPLARDELVVERTPVNRLLERSEVPAVRQEGDVIVVPVLEEILVTEKRLLLKEEVRITRVRGEGHEPQRVVLRTEQVSVERFDERNASVRPDGKSD